MRSQTRALVPPTQRGLATPFGCSRLEPIQAATGYSSPQLEIIDGVPHVLLINTGGAFSVAPQDGRELWKHEWNSDGIVQPAVIDGRDVRIGSGSGGAQVGIRRISISPGAAGGSVQERWTSNGLKPYFNDFVVHESHAYGFDGSILSCIDLADGTRKWKGGRYGQGQMVLLPDQELLLPDRRRGRARAGAGGARRVRSGGADSGDRGQDLEPPGRDRRHPAGSQQRGDGGVSPDALSRDTSWLPPRRIGGATETGYGLPIRCRTSSRPMTLSAGSCARVR